MSAKVNVSEPKFISLLQQMQKKSKEGRREGGSFIEKESKLPTCKPSQTQTSL